MNTITKCKIVKRKKAPVEFGAENIDNTAPVKKILDNLQPKNIQAFAYYCQTLRPRPAVKEDFNFHFTLTGHPLQAFPDDWEGDLNSGYFEPFSYKSLMPNILTQIRNIKKNDLVSEYIKLKCDWHRESKSLRHIAVCSSVMDKYESLNEEVVHCSKHLVDIAAHLDSDPDPYFDESYNWYYAGNGNLQLICIDWVDYLLHSEFSTLYLTPFLRTAVSITTEHVAVFNCKENILETICSLQNIVTIRTKHKITILKVISLGDDIEFEQIKSVESELPFTSISFDYFHKNILYMTTLNNKVTIVNIDRLTGRTVKLKAKNSSVVNNWNAVISSDRITYTHVTKQSINIYDKRTNNNTCSWNHIRDVTDHLGCNDITVARQYKDCSSLYYTTDHHLFLLDIRHQNKYKPKAVLRWTHGMQCTPTYMSLCDFEYNKEIICLNSQWCEDICLVSTCNRTFTRNTETSNVTMPYRPPSILDTLNEAKQKLLCLDVYEPIDDRLAISITGHLILEHGENYLILMQNSLGDISCHTLYPEHMGSFIDDDSVQQLHEWSKAYKQEKTPFKVTTVKDISNVWKELKKVPESYIFGETEFCKDNTKVIKKEVQEIFENEELDAGLLDIWTKDANESSGMEESSLAIPLYYSDEDITDCSR